MPGEYNVEGFTRKGGERVKAHQRSKPALSKEERKRRASKALEKLVPAAIKATGEKGFGETVEALKGKPGIESPEKLAGWLKGQAKAKGELYEKHPYVGRKGFKKYPEQAKKLSPEKYRAYLRERLKKS